MLEEISKEIAKTEEQGGITFWRLITSLNKCGEASENCKNQNKWCYKVKSDHYAGKHYVLLTPDIQKWVTALKNMEKNSDG